MSRIGVELTVYAILHRGSVVIDELYLLIIVKWDLGLRVYKAIDIFRTK